MTKRLFNALLIVSMLAVFVPVVAAAPPAQAKGQDYVVVKDDWLSKLADKYLGNQLSYPAIVALTNEKAAKDSSYATITNPDRIEVGWKLYIPSADEATAYMATYKPAAAAAAKEFIFGVILVGPYNDHGWSEAHYIAGQYAEKNVPGAKMIYLDKLNPADRKGTTLEQVADDMVAKGAQIIFATSDAFQTDADAVAAKYPKIPFIMISGDHVLTGAAPANMTNYMGRMVYGKMIAGCAAALTTQTGYIGYLGPLINDETRRLADSVYLGASYCYKTFRGKNPADLKFDVKWIGYWFNIPGVTLDPTEVANTIFDEGADVILSGIDTTQAIVVAGQRAKKGEKVWAIPYDYQGACAEAPDICLGVPYFNWGPAYVKYIKEAESGTFKQEFVWAGPDWKNINDPNTSPVGFVKGNALTADESAMLDKFIAGLGDGSIDLFTGPLNYQDGSVYLKAGEKATDKQIWYMPQLLQGMTGPSK
jgi:simple sugar transport system substrate-binding protein